MKRLHVHVTVENLEKTIHFYSKMFGQEPTVLKKDYAKWMLEDPLVNFAVSNRSKQKGVDHLGIQVESEEELKAVQKALLEAESPIKEEVCTSCCYAKSDKYWVEDPDGVVWEAFHSLETIPTYGEPLLNVIESQQTCCA